MFASLFLAHVVLAAADARRKVIIDQDAFGPGGSNQQAILLVLQSPEVEVLGITVVSGDGWRDENVAHTLRTLELVGRTEVPVLPGSTFPLVNSAEETKRWETLHGKLFYKGAWTESWPLDAGVKRHAAHGPFEVPPLVEGDPTTKPAGESAAAFMVRQVRAFPGEVTILAMGPPTNVALAVRLDDTFAANARELVVMGGSFRPQAAGDMFALEYAHTPRLEFNFRWDPEGTCAMLRAPWPKLTLVPIDPTTKTRFTPELMQRATASERPVAKYIRQFAETYPMWDELAAAVWLQPALVARGETLAVDVDLDHGAGYGNTLSWAAGHGPGLGERDVHVVFDIDVPAFEAFCVERFNR